MSDEIDVEAMRQLMRNLASGFPFAGTAHNPILLSRSVYEAAVEEGLVDPATNTLTIGSYKRYVQVPGPVPS